MTRTVELHLFCSHCKPSCLLQGTCHLEDGSGIMCCTLPFAAFRGILIDSLRCRASADHSLFILMITETLGFAFLTSFPSLTEQL